MYLKQATSTRIIELCNKSEYTLTRLAEMSYIPPSTFSDMMNNKRENPSSLIIYKICRTLKISMKDFYDSPLFENLED